MSTQNKDTLLTFPCEFTIKIIGKDSDAFEDSVFEILTKYQPSLTRNDLNSRLSAKGKYLALSVKLYVVNKEQLDNIYLELNASPVVILTL